MKAVYISDKITHNQPKNLSENVSRVCEACRRMFNEKNHNAHTIHGLYQRYGERDFKWKQFLMFQVQFVDISVEKYFPSFIIP